jgi:hypothetical protein
LPVRSAGTRFLGDPPSLRLWVALRRASIGLAVAVLKFGFLKYKIVVWSSFGIYL